MNKTQRLQQWYDERPAADSVLYGEHMHVGANQTILRVGLHGIPLDDSTVALDMACAVGGNGRWLASLYGCRVYGNDIDREAIEVATELADIEDIGDRCTFFVAPVSATGLESASCDLVVSTDVYEMGEVKRVLKPGGRFLLSSLYRHDDPSPEDLAARWELELETRRDVTQLAHTFHHAKEAEAQLLHRAGIIDNRQLVTVLNDIIKPGSRGGHHILARWRKTG